MTLFKKKKKNEDKKNLTILSKTFSDHPQASYMLHIFPFNIHFDWNTNISKSVQDSIEKVYLSN